MYYKTNIASSLAHIIVDWVENLFQLLNQVLGDFVVMEGFN